MSSDDSENGMSQVHTNKSEHMHRVVTNAILANTILSNSLAADDPDNPQEFPTLKKVLVSARPWLFAFTVALGLTSFTAGKNPFVAEFEPNEALPEKFIACFSIYLFGIAFAPYYSPHVVERVGRVPQLFVVLTLNAVFNVGAGASHTLAGVLICRFFAGLFGGATLVSLEGSFAELWSAKRTNSYYAVQGTAGYIGAGLGAIGGGYLVHDSHNWRWTCYFPACLAAFVMLISIGMPETYNREIPRRRAKKEGKTRKEVIACQIPPESGTTFRQMFHITVLHPIKMFLTEPVVTLCSLIMFFTWATTFQWFIAVPAALEPAPPAGPGFSVQRTGLAFLTAILGSIMAALSVILIENMTIKITHQQEKMSDEAAFAAVEYRVIPAMFGIALMTAGLFWVANTVAPGVQPVVPIVGTAFFVWGSGMVTFSIVPYTFDLYQPAPTLSAITSQAVGRILAAGFLPLVILFDLTGLKGPKWGLGTLGFISLAFWPIPYVLYFCGTKWRKNSKYNSMDLEDP